MSIHWSNGRVSGPAASEENDEEEETMSENQNVIAFARRAFGEAVMAPYDGNLTEEQQRKVVAEVKQLVVDMLDYCEQTELAEPALISAFGALDAVAVDNPLRNLVRALALPSAAVAAPELDVYTAWVKACAAVGMFGHSLQRDAFVAYEVGRLVREVGGKMGSAQELVDRICEADKKRGEAEQKAEKFAEDCRRLDAELHAAKRELERLRAEREHS